ncbi:methylated-DNA--[protein]-cysteine S-methyltransferase [Gulosibacter sediminis]|uniref:methylated-DNA--[protein]-cysteine S-methyltransferase n=1 Tax=Gulosibacter TaxID=256818 RepID=UPI003D15B9DC
MPRTTRCSPSRATSSRATSLGSCGSSRCRCDRPATSSRSPAGRSCARFPTATTTYGELAEQLGNRHLAQRVGQAVGHNPLSVIIPCHRVVGANGTLTGYAGGLERKRWLLELEEPEAASAARLF